MPSTAPKKGNVSYSVSIVSADTGRAISLDTIVTSINIYADMDTCSVHGDVTIQHNVNFKSIIKELPIVGREVIQIPLITYAQGDKSNSVLENLVFYVYAVDSLMVNGDQVTYTIRFTSAMGIISPAVRVCKRYEGQNAFTIIQDCLSEAGKAPSVIDTNFTLTGSNSSNTIDFFVPNWHPLDAALYLASIASSGSVSVSGVSESVADCVLYQSLRNRNQFCLRSYQDLFNGSEGSTEPIVWAPSNTQKNNSGYVEEYGAHIVNAQLGSLIDSQKVRLSGVAGSKVYWMDFRPGNKQAGGVNLLTAGVHPVTFQKIQEMIRQCTGKQGSSIHSFVYSNEFVNRIVPYNIHDEQSKNMWQNFVFPNKLYGPALHTAMKMYNATFQISTANPSAHKFDIGQTLKLETAGTDTSLSPLCTNSKWVISGLHYHVTTTDLQCFVSCFSPTMIDALYSGSEPTEIALAGSEQPECYPTVTGQTPGAGGGFFGGLLGAMFGRG